MFLYWNLDDHPSCGYTTTDERDPAAGEDIHLNYWVVYTKAEEFKLVMYWTVDGVDIQPANEPDDTATGQYNYSSTTTYTLPKKSTVQVECHTEFEVKNTEDPRLATNNPMYKKDDNPVVIDVKGEYENYDIHYFFVLSTKTCNIIMMMHKNTRDFCSN